ncbi:MAG: hypothetical protein BWY69_00058 [Planctomycetes bacterium ADurb.Bin401]|nr:MAG: hypothetical protein BWY69_00058 [Planctomycetes bacterium ADurb.Bin401]
MAETNFIKFFHFVGAGIFVFFIDIEFSYPNRKTNTGKRHKYAVIIRIRNESAIDVALNAKAVDGSALTY